MTFVRLANLEVTGPKARLHTLCPHCSVRSLLLGVSSVSALRFRLQVTAYSYPLGRRHGKRGLGGRTDDNARRTRRPVGAMAAALRYRVLGTMQSSRRPGRTARSTSRTLHVRPAAAGAQASVPTSARLPSLHHNNLYCHNKYDPNTQCADILLPLSASISLHRPADDFTCSASLVH